MRSLTFENGPVRIVLGTYISIHFATTARDLGAGVFGSRRSFHMAICEGDSDNPTFPAATIWTTPPSDGVGVGHFDDWEMDKLARIHVMKMCVTGVMCRGL